jgi:hypothetical protein
MLRHYVVVNGDLRKARAIERRWRVAGRRGQSIAEHVGHDDEVALGIERLAGTDRPLDVGVMSRIRRRIDHQIGLAGVEPAVSFVCELRSAQRDARAQDEVAEVEQVS